MASLAGGGFQGIENDDGMLAKTLTRDHSSSGTVDMHLPLPPIMLATLSGL